MSDRIPVAPDVLVWARQSARATLAEAAERTGQSEATVRGWETGLGQPTYSQLERLADEYGVSANVLLLPSRPNVPQPPPDFRVPGGAEGLSRIARRELRRARQLQALLGEVGVLPPLALPRIGPNEDSALIARAALGVTIDEQVQWRDANAAFQAWRVALTRLGVLVLQFALADDELQGLSLAAANGGPPVVFVNQHDWINARIFTLLHEFGHLLLGHDGGICDPWRSGPRSATGSIESRCNQFAGEVLVPSADLVALAEARHAAAHAADGETIRRLGVLRNRYRVSDQVIWYRLHDVGLVPDDRFAVLWPRLRPPVRRKRPEVQDEKRSGIPRWMMAGSRYGGTLIEGLLGAVNAGALEPTRAMRTLNLGTGDLARLQGEPRLE